MTDISHALPYPAFVIIWLCATFAIVLWRDASNR